MLCVRRALVRRIFADSLRRRSRESFFLGRYIRVALGLFVLVTKRFFAAHLPLFDATMPRRYARSDARDGDATSVDVQTRHPALKPRVSASACTIFCAGARGRGSAIRKKAKVFSKKNLFIFSVFLLLSSSDRGHEEAVRDPGRSPCALDLHSPEPSRHHVTSCISMNFYLLAIKPLI